MTAPCAWALLMHQLAQLDGLDPVRAPQHCPEQATQRVRFDRLDLGVFGVLVGEVCAGHAVHGEQAGGLHLGEIPRHLAATG